MKTYSTIDYSDARRALEHILDQARSLQKPVVAAVADAHGELLALARMDDAPVSSITIAINKAWTATRARKPTHEVGARVRHPENGHDISYYGDPKFTGWGGGVPVWKDGKVAGAVAVSGLSAEEDAELASAAAALITNS